MPNDAIPEEVRRFIAEHIGSVEQLEILLLMRRRPASEWTAEAVSEEVRTGPESAAKRLRDLQSEGLLTCESGVYRYAPQTSALEDAVDGLAAAYAERRYTVIEHIFSKPIENLRVYADAFRFRKRDDDDG